MKKQQSKNKKKLKPVTFVKGYYHPYYSKDDFRQNLLLQSLKITTDPKELKKMIGVRTVAEVYRTLDKLAMRKEYHNALLRHGLDLDSIVSGIKEIAQNASNEAIRLSGYQTLLKSLGLDRYTEESSSEKDWQEELLNSLEKDNNIDSEIESENYQIEQPEIPEEEKKIQKEEEETGKTLYE